ncbi:MAG: hypothetical protein OFPI_13920 [Osedax symbiont Rs2]|nr:MAG: hypothetical protein OFPI_13920 [Osedax symbiont Rs2]
MQKCDLQYCGYLDYLWQSLQLKLQLSIDLAQRLTVTLTIDQ